MFDIDRTRENEGPQNTDIGDLHSFYRILVAEDDRDLRHITAMLLQGAGYMVDEAQDGKEAWRALELNTYHLLMTDNNMPQMTGIELVKKMYSFEIKIPVILATGDIPTDELRRNPWLKVDAILLKPYLPVELLTKVENILNGLELSENAAALKSSACMAARLRLPFKTD